MNQIVKVQYPDPTNLEQAVLVVARQFGSYEIPITYDEAKDMSANISSNSPLAAEIYAALVEIIVEVEIGEDLAMFEVEELQYAMN